MMKKRIGDLFESRKGRMDYLLHRDFIDNGIVTFPCKISSFYDIVHPFSVRRYETLNQDFADFLELGASVVPPECPIVVNIIEDCLTDEERMIVKNLISEYYAYKLGLVEKEESRHTKRFVIMSVGLVAAAFLLWLSESCSSFCSGSWGTPSVTISSLPGTTSGGTAGRPDSLRASK